MAVDAGGRNDAMEAAMISGVWVPLVTPFKDGLVDLESYRRLIEHYLAFAGPFLLSYHSFFSSAHGAAATP